MKACKEHTTRSSQPQTFLTSHLCESRSRHPCLGRVHRIMAPFYPYMGFGFGICPVVSRISPSISQNEVFIWRIHTWGWVNTHSMSQGHTGGGEHPSTSGSLSQGPDGSRRYQRQDYRSPRTAWHGPNWNCIRWSFLVENHGKPWGSDCWPMRVQSDSKGYLCASLCLGVRLLALYQWIHLSIHPPPLWVLHGLAPQLKVVSTQFSIDTSLDFSRSQTVLTTRNHWYETLRLKFWKLSKL